MSAPLRTVTGMSIRIPVRLPSFICVELTTPGHPERGREITLPRSAPSWWVADAYLLSLGRSPRTRSEHDDCSDRCAAEMCVEGVYPVGSYDDSRIDFGDLEEYPDVYVGAVDPPPIGAPLVSVTAPGPSAPAGMPGDWLTREPPFREDDVNRELMRRHGVVMPCLDDDDYAATIDARLSRAERLGALLYALPPARRFALLAHIDERGLLEGAAPDLSVVESALIPLATLVARIGNGLAQEPTTGWLPDAQAADIARSLGWAGEGDEAQLRGDSVIDFARRARLIRRFKGRVVTTAFARRLMQPRRGTLDALTGLIAGAAPKSWGFPRSQRWAEEAAALLAVADGTVSRLDELPARAAAVAETFDTTTENGDDDPFAAVAGAAGAGDEQAATGWIIDGLAVLSSPKQFGYITPAMREVARRIAVGRLFDEIGLHGYSGLTRSYH